jgi:hypothetical protein
MYRRSESARDALVYLDGMAASEGVELEMVAESMVAVHNETHSG